MPIGDKKFIDVVVHRLDGLEEFVEVGGGTPESNSQGDWLPKRRKQLGGEGGLVEVEKKAGGLG